MNERPQGGSVKPAGSYRAMQDVGGTLGEVAGDKVSSDSPIPHGRRVALCAFSQSAYGQMLAASPLVPLEAEFGHQAGGARRHAH